MLPILKEGQDVLVLCWFYVPKVGDIVAVNINGRDMVKRIQKARDREYFVTGDNERISTDSRKFGSIKRSQIIGKVIWYKQSL